MANVAWSGSTICAFSAIIFAAFLLSPVAATPPCAPIAYFASYERPLWSVTLFEGSSHLSLETSFYSLHQVYDTLNPFKGPYDPIAPTAVRQPTAEKPFAYRDYDGDRNVSSRDEVIIYDPSAVYRYFLIGWGRNETSLGMIQGFYLRDNYWVACRTVVTSTVSPPDQLVFPAIALIVIMVLASQLLLRLRHARWVHYEPLFRH